MGSSSLSSHMALKPYLEKISGICEKLSKSELTEIILSLAKEASFSGRAPFLAKIQSYLPRVEETDSEGEEMMEDLLDDIEELRLSIRERVESIEEGTYWDYENDWEDYEEDPDDVSEEHLDDLKNLFSETEKLFLADRFEEAKKVYHALFQLVEDVEVSDIFSGNHEMNFREEQARYCRCVYETRDKDRRTGDFLQAMKARTPLKIPELHLAEDYPMLRDVIDSKPGEMEGLDAFLHQWREALSEEGTGWRTADLLLEVSMMIDGLSGVETLARAWKNDQPRGYIFWISSLEAEKNWSRVVTVGLEALKCLKILRYRESAAASLIMASQALGDDRNHLIGRRERFFSNICDLNLLEYVEEAIRQDVRDKVLKTVISFMKKRKGMDRDEKALYLKSLLMAGKLKEAFDQVKTSRPVGWSYGDGVGFVFGSVVSVLANHSEKAGTIKVLLEKYANKNSVFSGRVVVGDDSAPRIVFSEEIIDGLKRARISKTEKSKYLSWAKKIGEGRIDHIVGNKHRNAYGRAAQILGCLAETHAAMGSPDKAKKTIYMYYNEKYKRYSAFKREVRTVVNHSVMMKEFGISV